MSVVNARSQDEDVFGHPVNINGHSLKLGDLFSEHNHAREFKSKLALLGSKPGEPKKDATVSDPSAVASLLFGSSNISSPTPPVSQNNPTVGGGSVGTISGGGEA